VRCAELGNFQARAVLLRGCLPPHQGQADELQVAGPSNQRDLFLQVSTPPTYRTYERDTTMTAMFVNLPVTDLERAKAFYTAIGFTINFTDHNTA